MKFLIIYKGAVQPGDGQKHMEDWMKWASSLGDALIEPGAPVHPSFTVSADGITETSSENPICGMSMIEATDLKAATAMVQTCPHIALGGTMELAETIDMAMK